MTKEEALRRTKGYLYDVLSGEEADEIIKALDQKLCDDMEIEYLKARALFNKVVKSSDCISRHDVKMIIINEMEGFPTDDEISLLTRLMKQFEKLPSVAPQEPKTDVIDKIRAEIKALTPKPTAYDVVDGNPVKDVVWETLADVLQIIDKYKPRRKNK